MSVVIIGLLGGLIAGISPIVTLAGSPGVEVYSFTFG